MTRLGVTATALAAGALLWSSYAKADPITVNAQTPATGLVTIVDHQPSAIAFSNVMVDGTMLTGTGVGTPPDSPGRFSTNVIPVAANDVGAVIQVWFTEQNLTNPSGKPLTVTSGLTVNLLQNATITESTFLDPTNSVAPPTGTPLATDSFTAPGTHQSLVTLPSPTGTYSLQELYDITITGANESANLTIDVLASPIPEPSTLALLGTGLVLMAIVFRRRFRLMSQASGF